MKFDVKWFFSRKEINIDEQQDMIRKLCRDTYIKEYEDITVSSTLNIAKEYISNISRDEIPIISSKRMKVIIIASFWISMKFNSDDHSDFRSLDFVDIIDRDINPNHIILEERDILKKINWGIWRLMIK